MSLSYDLYQRGDSWLHRLDARVKLLGALCGCGVLLLYRNLWVMLAALLLTHLLLASAQVARARILWVWKLTLPTMAMIALLWVLFYPGEGPILLTWWVVRVTVHNLAQGLAMGLRISALAFTIFLWLFTTDQSALVRSLVALGMPYAWGLTLAMALRYLPTMASTLRMISDAQQARALDLTRGNPLQRARAYMPILVAMLITALRTAENLSRALESRALGVVPRRTYLRALHMRRGDVVAILLILTAAGLLVWARFAWGAG